MTAKSLRLILNGKKAGLPAIREAVHKVRADGHAVDVRVTWEAGDGARLAAEALEDDVDVIVAGGGDGTVNELVNGIFNATDAPEKAVGVMPLGSANDFARGCGIPMTSPLKALRFAATAEPQAIDVARVNDFYFVNAAILGFGAEVTFQTSERMKRAVHGAAYGITGFLTALKRTVYKGYVKTPDGEREGTTVFAVLANGIQAGGFKLAPRARLNDGLLDLMSVPDFSMDQLPILLKDLQNLKKATPAFIQYEQLKWMEVEAEQEVPISPDGEEFFGTRFRMEVFKQRLPFVLPDGPLLQAD
jgi:lipid kinase YegS